MLLGKLICICEYQNEVGKYSMHRSESCASGMQDSLARSKPTFRGLAETPADNPTKHSFICTPQCTPPMFRKKGERLKN
jgi:hypothetical protein